MLYHLSVFAVCSEYRHFKDRMHMVDHATERIIAHGRRIIDTGVCETHVILIPDSCGREGPGSTSCHHFSGTAGTTGPDMQIPPSSFLIAISRI